MKQQFQEVLTKTERILKSKASSRDNDLELIVEYILNFTSAKLWDKSKKEELKDIFFGELPSLETITRCRRKLNENGLYIGSAKTRSARFAKQKAMRLMMSK